MYLRALSHDDDVERREESGQNGAQISHKIIAFGTKHLKEKSHSRGLENEDNLMSVFSKSLLEINLNLIIKEQIL